MTKQKGGIVNSSKDGQIKESEQFLIGLNPSISNFKIQEWQKEFIGNKDFVFKTARSAGKNYINQELQKAAEAFAKAMTYSVDAHILVKNGMAEVQSDGSVKLNDKAQVENLTPKMIKETMELLKSTYPQDFINPGKIENIFGNDSSPKIHIPDDHEIDSFRYTVGVRFGIPDPILGREPSKWSKIWFKIKVKYYILLFKIEKCLKKIKK